MKKILICLLLVQNVILFGCDSNNEQGIRDSRSDFMEELKGKLTENKIPYRIDDEGFIRYSSEYKVSVERIREKIDKHRATEVGSKFKDERSTTYFRKLLDEHGIKYRSVKIDNEDWTYWNPESKEQQEKIEMQVVTHAFKNK